MREDAETGCTVVETKVADNGIGISERQQIDKPFELDELDTLLERALQSVNNKQLYTHNELHKLVAEFSIIMAENSPLKDLLLLCKKIAPRKISVLIQGETGTGKEVLARFIHANILRSGNPFISVNCGALTESLLESELFGHEKGLSPDPRAHGTVKTIKCPVQ